MLLSARGVSGRLKPCVREGVAYSLGRSLRNGVGVSMSGFWKVGIGGVLCISGRKVVIPMPGVLPVVVMV